MIGPIELLVILIILPALIAFVWALVDAIRRPESQYPNGSGKTLWVAGLIVSWLIGLGWIVGIAYLIVVRRAMGAVRSVPPGGPPAPTASSAPPPPPTA